MSCTIRSKGKFEYNSNYIENCSEMELFLQVNKYYEFLEQLNLINYYNQMVNLYQQQEDFRLANYFKRLENSLIERMPNEVELKLLEDTLDYCVLQTARFNTKVCDNNNGRIKMTPEFTEWYYRWVNYVDNMNDEDYALLRKYRYEGKSLEYFTLDRPSKVTDIESKIKQKTKKVYYPTENENIRQKFA